ncbi:MAG: HIT family protein [Patescibacteria group bacterium]
MSVCLFCSFVAGEIPCHRVWEDEGHLAFLTIFPNTPGFTVVIPKVHRSSYAFDLPTEELSALVAAAKTVAKLIDRAFDDVGRTALIFEGFGVDHVHAKLIPLHGTRMEEWRPILSALHPFTEKYEGFITTHDGPRASDEELARIADRIRNA